MANQGILFVYVPKSIGRGSRRGCLTKAWPLALVGRYIPWLYRKKWAFPWNDSGKKFEPSLMSFVAVSMPILTIISSTIGIGLAGGNISTIIQSVIFSSIGTFRFFWLLADENDDICCVHQGSSGLFSCLRTAASQSKMMAPTFPHCYGSIRFGVAAHPPRSPPTLVIHTCCIVQMLPLMMGRAMIYFLSGACDDATSLYIIIGYWTISAIFLQVRALTLSKSVSTVALQDVLVQFVKRTALCASHPAIAEVSTRAKQVDKAPHR